MDIEDAVLTAACWIERDEHVHTVDGWAQVENVVHHDDDTITIEFVDGRPAWSNLHPGTAIYYYAGV